METSAKVTPERVVELLGLFYRSIYLEEIATAVSPKVANLIRYEANDLRARISNGDGCLGKDCVSALEAAIGQLPEENGWLRNVIGTYPTHYAEDHKAELSIEQYALLASIPHYYRY
jgi:hypothetical protein